ncbi:TonB-dependent receptor [Pedobacter frigidisoli]|uniref:TonB-dependent receptor n=1 Tax=Pedobacter frigidisoli TaxID=2530455 RepID=UPI00292D0354|nr:TonB-dependent receptor [Pedobacter frigidisoli]
MLKTKLFSLTFLLSLIAFTSFAQQLATIKGKVTTSDGAPAPFISVGLKGKGIGNTSDENGNFLITRVKPGTYTVKVSAVGLKSDEKNVTVSAGETITVNFSLAENSSQLKEVNIITSKANKFGTKASPYVAKLPLKNLENPQVYNTVSKELMADQMVTNFSSALTYVAGLDKLWTSTGRAGDGAAYYTLRGFSTQVALVDGVAGLTNGDLDPANIETIEVIKGPSGTLFGGALTNFGGLINIVTKKPIDTLGGNVTYNTGSFGLSRLTGDIYGPLAKDLSFRLNVANTKQNSWQDAGFSKSTFLAPALEYRINDRLKLNIGAEFYSYEGTNPTMIFLNRSRQLIARTPTELNIDWGKSYTSNDLAVKTPTSNVHGQLTYQISDEWTSQTNFSQSNRKSEGYYQYVMFLGANDNVLSRYVANLNSVSTSADVQQNFIGDFKIGSIRNRMIVGLDYLNQYTNNSNTPYILFDQFSTAGMAPVISKDAVNSRIGTFVLPPLTAANAPTKNDSRSKVYSAYASDVINITDALSAMLSVRVDRFDNKGTYNQLNGLVTGNYLQTAVSPKFGLVYGIVKDKLSVFGNYMNGFRNVGTVTQPLADISGVFKPQQANQIEGGVKADLFNNKLSFTASYYDIKVNNTTRSESIVRDGTTYNITVQDGTQVSRGVDISLSASPIAGLNLTTGYSHNNSKMTKSALTVEGLRPVGSGPEDSFNAWLSYTISNGKFAGLGAGAGVNYSGNNIITNTTTTGAFTLPAYTIYDASVFYDQKRYRIGAKVNNIGDIRYYKGWTTVEAQLPRNFTANISYKF